MAPERRKLTGCSRISTSLSPPSSCPLLISVLVVFCLRQCASAPATVRDVYRLKSNSIRAFLELESARRSCVDKTLEVRERQAEAIFSGTVQSVDPPSPPGRSGGGPRRAVVAVKRIIKGDRVVDGAVRAHLSLDGDRRPGRPLVVVGGIGDPRICLSTARKYDTRIFLVRDDGRDNLVLNSSLVPLTLYNIDHADAVVRSQ